MANELKPCFGQMIKCSAYIKHSGNSYMLFTDDVRNTPFSKEIDIPMCSYWENGTSVGAEVEDYHECERFSVIPKEFSGVYVGTTTLNSKISAEHHDDPYSGEHYKIETRDPKKYAIVYYASGKKRLVPLENIEAWNRRWKDG